MDMIKAIVFDIGGVLIDLNLDRCKRTFREKLGFNEIDQMLDASHQKGMYSDLEEGKITSEEFIGYVLEHSRPGMSALDVKEAVWSLLEGIEPYKTDLLNGLSGNFRIYALSNNNGISMERIYRMFSDAGIPADRTFRKMFLSYRMKMLKPSREIFLKAISEIGLEPEEILYIDDSVSNVDAAAETGMRVLHYIPGTDLSSAVMSVLE